LFCCSAASGTLHADARGIFFYFCRWHKLILKALLFNPRHFDIVGNDWLLSNALRRHCCVSIAKEVERKRHSIAVRVHCLSCFKYMPSNFFIIIPTRCTNFSNLFWNETLHVPGNSFAHHQDFFTVHTAIVYVIQVCRQLSSRIRMEFPFHPDPAARKLSTNMYDIYHC
jgi:hypothetical protein